MNYDQYLLNEAEKHYRKQNRPLTEEEQAEKERKELERLEELCDELVYVIQDSFSEEEIETLLEIQAFDYLKQNLIKAMKEK